MTTASYFFTFVFFFFTATQAFAQTEIESSATPLRHIESIPQFEVIDLAPSPFRTVKTPAPYKDNNTALADHLRQSMKRLWALPAQTCQSAESYDYAVALTVKGAYDECQAYAESCASTTDVTPVPTLIQGARCARLNYRYERALDLFEAGFQAKDASTSDISALVLEYANFAQYTLYPEKTDAIIARHPRWSPEQKNLARGLIDVLGENEPKLVTRDQVAKFVEAQISQGQDFYKRLMKVHRLTLTYSGFRFVEAGALLWQDARSFVNPLDWWKIGYQTLYRLAEGADFTLPLGLYRAFIPYANPRSYLPQEQNVYTYTQIYDEVCRDNMLQGSDLANVRALLAQWKSGTLALPDLKNALLAKLQTHPLKSDLLNIYGGLLSMTQDYTGARDYLWRAHVACPFNNRSHWGLLLLERKERFRSYPEYEKNVQLVERTVKGLSFPPEAETFFVNWSSLPQASRDRVKYGARIWAPYIAQMLSEGSSAYIKPPFELLSDGHEASNMRDRRIGPPDMPSYQYDNRLWDDVRGRGGISVAADHDETFESVQGDYNLLGHEMAHQFHSFLEGVRPAIGGTCIRRLYAAAKARNLFSDGYAGSNEREYFAQGITYYLIPADAPARYGINKSWAKKNDPDLYKFFESIEAAQGDVAAIACPI